ncbi:cilia- and flagella-associated protein 99 isoform X2 [Lepisosteus oculatus]
MTTYGRLVKEVVQLLGKFDPENHCIETFIEDASTTLKHLDVSEEMFVWDVLAGCIDYKKLLDVVVDAFYARCGKSFLHSERNVFAVICYLATFLLEELGLQHFSNIVKSQDVNKMYKFLGFFFDVTNLSTWIKDEWSHIYDAPFVENNWITPLLRWQPKMETLMAQLSDRVTRGSPLKKAAKKHTEPREFGLTRPKPRAIPLPELIPQQERHKPIPSTTYRPPREIQSLEEEKLRNRQMAETALLEANSRQFKCANAEKSERSKQVISQIVKETEAKLKFDAHYSSGTPAFYKKMLPYLTDSASPCCKTQSPRQEKKSDSVPIKLNTTAILREGALYNRRVEEELRRVERLAGGAGDPSRFLQWQRAMRERDLQRQLADVERRRLEGQLSHEEAVLARHRLLQENQRKAQLKKEETAEMMRRYAELRLEEEKGMKELVEVVAEGHKNSKEAKAKLKEYKQRIVQEVSEQSRELLRQALEEAQAELSRKFELIRQIRALESVPVIRHRFVDLTEAGGHALLGEMSVVELRERLALLKEAARREQEERRDRILEEKQVREQLLLEQLDHIALHRAVLGRAAALRQEEKKARAPALRARAIQDERVSELQRKLEEKRQQRQRQSESLKMKAEKSTARSLKAWSVKKQSQEEQHWRELERSLERQVQLGEPGPVAPRLPPSLRGAT